MAELSGAEPCKQIVVFFKVSGKPPRFPIGEGREYPKIDS
jgi:hypothetical protein